MTPPLAQTLGEYIAACFTGLWVQSFEHEDALQEIAGLCRELVQVHHQLHAIDYRQVGLENFGKPAGYVKRQVLGWSQRYRAARTPDAPDCEDIMAWLEEQMPADFPRPAIIHNDFKLDNVVLDKENPGRSSGCWTGRWPPLVIP